MGRRGSGLYGDDVGGHDAQVPFFHVDINLAIPNIVRIIN